MSRFRDNNKNKQRGGANQSFRPRVVQDAPISQIPHEIKLDAGTDKTLASILFRQDRGNLYQYFGQKFGVQLDVGYSGGDTLTFYGDPDNASRTKRAFAMLSGMVGTNAHIDKGTISSVASQVNPPAGAARAFKSAANQNSRHEGGSAGGDFKPLNDAQATLAKMIDDNDLVFALGPAGTGKTHVAVVKGIAAFKAGTYKKLLLARPAAEAGEKIGFLPGDANAKLAPYMRPIYDELDKAFGPGAWKGMMEDGRIEIVPVGYMRGRTFDDAFIIVDESQNLTIEQAKMAITRIGKNAKMVMTGDPQQIDLRDKNDSGLIWASEIMEGKPGAAKQVFVQTDVVRSPIVQTFVSAIDEWEIKTGKKAEPTTPTASASVVENDVPPFAAEAVKGQPKQGPGNPRW